MSLKKYSFPYGDSHQDVELPEEKVIQVITGNDGPSLKDVHAATLQAIRNPIGSKPLAAILKKGDKVAIVVSDITRGWIHTPEFLPAIIEEANGAGVSDKNIIIVIATGTHRAHTAADNDAVCGPAICKRIKVESHDCLAKDLVFKGTTSRGTPVWLNHTVATADKVILTGGITVHLIAGFGGGRKSIVPGVVGNETVLCNHRQCMAEKVGDGISPLSSTTIIEHNPLHEDMDDAAAIVNPDFLVNAVMAHSGKFARIVAGHWRDAWAEGCKEMIQIEGVPAKAKADVVFASSGGYPRDINLYQGSKTFDTLKLALKPDGIAIVILECREMFETVEFNNFYHFDTILDMEKAVREEPSIPHIIAFGIFDVAKKNTCYLVTKPENFEQVRKTNLIPVATVEEAWKLAQKELEKRGKKDYTINIMPQAATTVPIIK